MMPTTTPIPTLFRGSPHVDDGPDDSAKAVDPRYRARNAGDHPDPSTQDVTSPATMPWMGYAFIACRTVWRARTARQGVLRPVAAFCGARS